MALLFDQELSTRPLRTVPSSEHAVLGSLTMPLCAEEPGLPGIAGRWVNACLEQFA